MQECLVLHKQGLPFKFAHIELCSQTSSLFDRPLENIVFR